MDNWIFKRFLSLFLVFLLVFEVIPSYVFADDQEAVSDEQSEGEDPEGSVLPEGTYGSEDDIIVEEFARNKATAEKTEITEEAPEKRSEFQKEFMLDSGMHLVTVYPVSVHYEESGKWEEIDNTLVRTEEKGEGYYSNTAGLWKVYLPEKMDSEKDVILDHDGYELRFRLEGEIGLKEDPAEPEEPGLPDNPEDEEEQEEAGGVSESDITESETAEGGEVFASSNDTSSDRNEDIVLSEEENREAVWEPFTFSSEPSVKDPEAYSIRPIKEAKGVIEEEEEETSKSREILEKINSSIRYEGVLPDTDLAYRLVSNELKETITISELREGLAGYRYYIEAEGLMLEMGEDKEIRAYEAGSESDPLFYLPAPFLYDEKHEVTKDIDILLEEAEGGYYLTYLLPEEWLGSPERVYPVRLDPVVRPVYDQENIRDRTVASNYTFPQASPYIEAGKVPGSRGIERIYMKFNDIPDLTSSEVVVSASISMYKWSGNTGQTVEVHKVDSDWDSSTITWGNKPGYGSLIEDFAIVSSSGGYTWDITNIAQEWYLIQDSCSSYPTSRKAEA